MQTGNKLIINDYIIQNPNNSIHLAIFSEPHLSALINKKKTLESRFSRNKIAPFEKVKFGDLVFVKRNGGPIVGYFIVGKVKYISKCNGLGINKIKQEYKEKLFIDSQDSYWDSKLNTRFASILEIMEFTKINPIRIIKKNRISWCVLHSQI